jgi:hypothetical protein
LFCRKLTILTDKKDVDPLKPKHNVRWNANGTGIILELAYGPNKEGTKMGFYTSKKWIAVWVSDGTGVLGKGTTNYGPLIEERDALTGEMVKVTVVQDTPPGSGEDGEGEAAPTAVAAPTAEAAEPELILGCKVDVVHKGATVACGSLLCIGGVGPPGGTTMFGFQKIGAGEVHVCITSVVDRDNFKNLLKSKAFVANPSLAVGDWKAFLAKLDADPIKYTFNVKYVFVCFQFNFTLWRVLITLCGVSCYFSG